MINVYHAQKYYGGIFILDPLLFPAEVEPALRAETPKTTYAIALSSDIA